MLKSEPHPIKPPPTYRGRLAPSPTGYLHLGHAWTFWTAARRCVEAQGTLVLRKEDLDNSRVRPEFATALREDLRWFGVDWQEGPDCGGPFAPYLQSQRLSFYRDTLQVLHSQGLIYPCTCSRQDVLRSIAAPHANEDEPLYPGTCRNHTSKIGTHINWRFRVPDGQAVEFVDGNLGPQRFVAGIDFGDFIVWRADNLPAYQLAVVTDDAAMGITEVVRGADLLRSTARQLLLYRALGLAIPSFYHCVLATDEHGVKLSKRNNDLTLHAFRNRGFFPEQLRLDWIV